jgi:histidinol-phosphate phosphatase family protein
MRGPFRAAIVAGGQGTRIRSISGDVIPKAMVPVAGAPVVVRLLELLARYGVRDVAVLAGHLAGALQAALPREARKLGIGLEFFVESEPLGTAGGLLAARGFLSENDFCVVYGDMVIEMDLHRLHEFHCQHGGIATMVTHPNDHPHDSDIVVVDGDSRVRRIVPGKGRALTFLPNRVPAGVYLLAPAALDHIRAGGPQDFIKDVFPELLRHQGGVFSYHTPEYLRDMGTPERYAMAESDILSGRLARMNRSHRRPAVFLDRDGVLVEEVDRLGLCDPDRLSLIPRAAAAVRLINHADRLAVVATNQPVVAKGLVSLDQLDYMHAKMETLLGLERAKLDGIYFCPHHPEKGHAGEVPELKVPCECRKPRPGMLLAAARELPISLDESCLIGDAARDVGAARAAGIYFYGVRTGCGCRDCTGIHRPDLIFDDVFDAAKFAVHGAPEAGENARLIADLAMSRHRVVTVGICGIARAGKSTRAHGILKDLRRTGVTALHVRMDDWIVPRSRRGRQATAEERCQVGLYAEIVAALKSGDAVRAPGYEPASRELAEGIDYSPGGAQVILLEGLFACHGSIRPQLDFKIYVDAPEEEVRKRFFSFYRWKEDEESTIETLWLERKVEEWPFIRRQQDTADRMVRLAMSDEGFVQ